MEQRARLLESLAQKAIKTDGINHHLDQLFKQDPQCFYYRFIYFLVRILRPKLSVELGVCTGRGTAHLAAGNLDGMVLAIDPEKHGAFEENTRLYTNIIFIQKRSDDVELLNSIQNQSVDLCFIDSVHAFDYTLKEVKLWTPKMKSGGIFLFDDLELDEGMKKVLPALPFTNKSLLPDLHHKGFGYAIV